MPAGSVRSRAIARCQVRDVDELLSREGARLRTATGRAGTISAVDAIVAAMAGFRPGTFVYTSDPSDLRALGQYTAFPVTVVTA
jgi:hypothetical protein